MNPKTVLSSGRAGLCVVLLAVLGVAGCASGPVAPEAMDRAAKSQVVPPDQAALYLLRANSFYGAAVLKELTVDGGSRTHLSPGNYALILVAPGEHRISVVGCNCPGDRPAEMTLPTDPGKRYFVSIEGDFTRMPGDPASKLVLMPPEEGSAALKELRLVRWIQ